MSEIWQEGMDEPFINPLAEQVKRQEQEEKEELEYLDRLWSFGEGYFDFTNFEESFSNKKNFLDG